MLTLAICTFALGTSKIGDRLGAKVFINGVEAPHAAVYRGKLPDYVFYVGSEYYLYKPLPPAQIYGIRETELSMMGKSLFCSSRKLFLILPGGEDAPNWQPRVKEDGFTVLFEGIDGRHIKVVLPSEEL